MRRNQPYALRGRTQLLLDLYLALPRHVGREAPSPRSQPPAPTVLWFHPGGFRSGSKDIVPIDWLTRCGFNVASVGYRLAPAARYPGQVMDAVDAVAWLRDHAEALHLQPDRFAAVGVSAGAYLAAMSALAAEAHHPDPVPIGGVVNVAGFTDLLALQSLPTRRDRKQLGSPEARLLGRHPDAKDTLAAEASPVSHVSPASPPFLHIHGERDEIVPLDQSRHLHDRLKAAGVSSKLVVIKGLRHDVKRTMANEGVQDRMLRFLRRVLMEPR